MELVPVVELRQWTYCPRVVYYHLLMTGVGRSTYKMEEGLRAQDLIEGLEMRRTLREYGLTEAERRFSVWLSDEGAGLTGKVDLLLKGKETASVVDFKLTSGEMRGMRIRQFLRRRLVILADWSGLVAIGRSASISRIEAPGRSLKCETKQRKGAAESDKRATKVSPSRRGLKRSEITNHRARSASLVRLQRPTPRQLRGSNIQALCNRRRFSNIRASIGIEEST